MRLSDCKLMFVVAFVAVAAALMFCTVMQADESSADSSGRVLNTSSEEIGSYELVGYTLSVEADSPKVDTTIILENFTEQDSVQKVEVTNFVNDISGSFSTFQYLDTIEYSGPVDTGGKWKFEYFSGTVNLTAMLDNSAEFIQLQSFNMQYLVTNIQIKGYTKDLSSSFSTSMERSNRLNRSASAISPSSLASTPSKLSTYFMGGLSGVSISALRICSVLR